MESVVLLLRAALRQYKTAPLKKSLTPKAHEAPFYLGFTTFGIAESIFFTLQNEEIVVMVHNTQFKEIGRGKTLKDAIRKSIQSLYATDGSNNERNHI